MNSGNSLRVLRNENFNSRPKVNGGNKKRSTVKFGIFIIVTVCIFSAMFIMKNKFDKVNNMQENLSFQKQKLMEERVSMENKLKEQNDKLLKLQSEYEEKNKQLTSTLDSIKVKEESLNSKIKKVDELRGILQKQLVDIYGLNMDKQYSGKDGEGVVNNSSSNIIDDKGNDSIHMNVVSGKDKEESKHINERMLSVADADWFIKLDSLGEFTY